MSQPLLITIVDDDQSFRAAMRRLMRSLGYKVDVFSSAADFIASHRLGETACLITDVNMPGMTGMELHRHLKESGWLIPTILVTGYPNDADGARALKDGVVCYLRKPVDAQKLSQCLQAALSSQGSPEDDS